MSSCLRLVVLSPRIFCFLVFLDVSRFLCHVREDADSVSGFSWVTKGVSHLSDPPYHLLLQCIYFSIFVQMLTFSDCLRVEFLLKTDSGYPRDAEVTLFTLANPEYSLRFNTHWSAPPVSALARSGGPRKMSQSPVSRNSNVERRMDRPRAVVGVIRGVA